MHDSVLDAGRSARGNATTVLKPRGGSAPASRQAFSCCGSVTTSPRGDLAWAGAGGAALSSSSRFMAQRRQGRALLGWRAGLPGIRAALTAPETRLSQATEACKPGGRVSLGEALKLAVSSAAGKH